MSFNAHDLLQIRNDHDYRNWHAAGDALLFLSDGLRKYAESKMKELHAIITKDVGGPTVVCSCRSTHGKKLNRHGTACIWAQEIKKFHVFKNKADIPWHQSDSSKWHDPVVGHWEIAKLFMSDLGSDPAKVTDPDSTDVGPLLNLIRFCNHFKVQKPLFKAVTDRRNQWAHAPNHTLTDAGKKDIFQDIKFLMNDPALLRSKEVQDCKPIIKKVEKAEVSILEANHLRLMEELSRFKAYENLREKLDAANKEIEFLKSLINRFFILLLFLLSNMLENIPNFLRCFVAFVIFSYVGDKNGMEPDDGKMTV
jgi:hypothetical protein